MLEEFKIAQKLGKVIIPVGSTGGAAAKIFADMQIEADSEEEARDIAYEADTYDVDEWCVDIDECERIDD